MKIIRLSAVAATAALIAGAASAATFTVYTDRTTFEAAAGALTTETFAGVNSDTSFAGGSASHNDITMAADDTTTAYNKFDVLPASSEVDVNGSTMVNVFTQAASNASMTFNSAIRAWGADFKNLNDTQSRTDISILGEVLTPSTEASGAVRFFGVISDMDFTTVNFVGKVNDVFGIDDVSYGGVAPIPVPASLPLLLAGLVGAGAFARRRKG